MPQLDFAAGWISLLIFMLILSGLVFVHELGHFLAARLLGVHVEEFGLGFPPRALGLVRDKDNKWRVFFGLKAPPADVLGGPKTIYSLNWLPIGGFIRPAGEDNPDIPGGLAAAPKLTRLAVLAAGSTFNLIFALLVFAIAFRINSTVVGIAHVEPESPAAAAGLQAGDIVLKVNNTAIRYIIDLQDIVAENLGQPIEMVIKRGEQEIALTATPRTLDQIPPNQGALGVTLSREMFIGPGLSWPQAIGRAFEELWLQFRQVITLPSRVLRGQISAELARPVGPVGMYQMTDAVVEVSQANNTWFPLVQYVGLISIALGITNLLPLPALDGGRILFVLFEAVRGRRVDPAREGMVHLVGMMMLLALMVFITYQDIVNPAFTR